MKDQQVDHLSIELTQPTPPSNPVLKSIFAGTIGGITQVLIGQPFDIIKVRLQSSNEYKSMLDAATQISKKEGFTGFYKGTSLPLIGIGACVAIQFGCLEASKKTFREYNLVERPGSQLSLTQLYLAGATAGVGNSIISGPVEHIRIRLQTSTKLNRFNGPMDGLKKILKSDGLFRGLYCGQSITVAREFHGYGMYFLGYEWLVERHMRSQNCARSEIGISWAMLYGAAAGYSMWLSSYPLDQIKTRIQNDALPSQIEFKKYFGIFDCMKKIYIFEGFKGFFKGLTPTLIRSPLVNGATFVAFEATMKLIKSD